MQPENAALSRSRRSADLVGKLRSNPGLRRNHGISSISQMMHGAGLLWTNAWKPEHMDRSDEGQMTEEPGLEPERSSSIADG